MEGRGKDYKMNRAQQRAQNSTKATSKTQLLARAQAAEAGTQMFKGFYEEQIRVNERVVIEAEGLVQQAQLEQRATERTIEVMLFQLTTLGDAYQVEQGSIDTFNENDDVGEHFVHVEQTDDGFDMTLVFEPFEIDSDEQEDEDDEDTGTGSDVSEDTDTTDDGETVESEDSEDSGQDGESAADGDTNETG